MFDDYRPAWKAAKPLRTPTYVDPLNRSEFFVHYDGAAPLVFDDHAGCLARVKANQTFHMSSRAWSDIGYNGLVCQHGRAIEGRGIDYSGAHCPDHNTSGYGFQFMVGGGQQPTEAAKARMRRLYDDACDHSKRTLAKRGHRDGFATACPGDGIYAWVKAGMPAPAQEEDMANVTDAEKKQLLDAAALIRGIVRERYYVLEDGVLSLADKSQQGAQRAFLLDTIDGNTLSGRIAAAALDPAVLAAAVKAQGIDVDTTQLATALAKAITNLAQES